MRSAEVSSLFPEKAFCKRELFEYGCLIQWWYQMMNQIGRNQSEMFEFDSIGSIVIFQSLRSPPESFSNKLDCLHSKCMISRFIHMGLTEIHHEENFSWQVPDANNPVKRKEERQFVEFDGPADSVYLNVPDRLVLEVGTGKPDLHLYSIAKYSRIAS